jgi:hypothetical protein
MFILCPFCVVLKSKRYLVTHSEYSHNIIMLVGHVKQLTSSVVHVSETKLLR